MAVGSLSAVLPASAQQTAPAPAWDTYSDTWVGVDGLGRVLPTHADVGGPRPGRTLGVFYFLTFAHGSDGPYDNTQILKAHPEAISDIRNPAWGPLNSSHHWGEPLFGYYASDDEYVLRKHAQMLAAAGVDVVIFDNSNAVTYDKARNTLCRAWEEIRRRGGKTPQIAFLCPFGNPDHIGTSTLNELYDTLYGPGLYRDLWFRWQGKPLVMADPSYADAAGLLHPSHVPVELPGGGTLGQTFTADRPFLAIGGEFPTWNTTSSGMTLSLYAGGPGGPLLARRDFQNVTDNAALLLKAGKELPPGRYYLEMSRPVGHIGWWGYSADVYGGGHAVEDGVPAPGDRSLLIRFAGEAQPQALSPDARRTTPEAAAERARTLRDFFTFRTPIAPYNIQSPPPEHWAWLQVYPQAPQRDAAGQVEQVTVGVAQNYNATVNNTAPMSIPGAFGRSYHDGKMDTRPGAVNWGYNFAEQWRRALQLDPPFIFVTGWNEWTAGFYDSWVQWHAPPPIFVDEFTEEYSRDIEPMQGGHGDDYYYQLVANVRRYKGVRPLPPVTPRPITIDGRFGDWKGVGPEFRDAIGDPAHRDAPGYGQAGPYVNTTGRNDIVAAKVSYDAKNVYFYVRTQEKLTPRTDPDWMLLYINADADYKTGWLGYDFVVNRHVGNANTSLERNVGGQYKWRPVARVRYGVRGNEMEIAIPRVALSIGHLPATVDFKWADHCYARGDWTDFTLNGDAAPDDRFNYRAVLEGVRPSPRPQR
ncbi:MAG: hypothetical protein JO250_10610 [Armatimonadetes bacterium]|nr:hypothetical protein [Armatimonadota bacterium]